MKKIIYACILFLASASILNSIHAIYVLLQKRDLLVAAQQSLQKQQNDNKMLKNQLQIVSSKAFIEEEARNKLFFSKPGESTVLIAKELIASKSATPTKIPQKSNWDRWLQAFFPGN